MRADARPRPAPRSARSPAWLAFVSALALVALYNGRFWSETVALQSWDSPRGAVFLASLFLVLVALYAAVLLLIPGVRLLKIVLVCAVLAGAFGAYFANSYGVAIDRDMIRSVVQTDVHEAAALLNVRFALYLLLLGLLPAVLITRARIASAGLWRELSRRAAAIGGSLVFCAAVALLMGAQYASFLREHKALRYLITPANIVNGAVAYFRDGGPRSPAQLADLESPVSRAPAGASSKPLVMFLVIGETARAQNFQLGGYARPTTPELAKRGVYYFRETYSCGTSTAVSLPCMFSGTPRESYDAGRGPQGTNLLDALAKAGLYVEWRDNNSGCKGLCERVAATDYAASRHATLCTAAGCVDEVMQENLGAALAKVTTDTVIVFHQAGSHGPAYSQRYPREFEVFKPVCYGNELSRCSREEVVNAYDNSLRYTDHVVAAQIDALQAAAAKVDGILVYVSDHGESLGEKGLYLHGTPYMFAPEEQKHVPMLVWMSAPYRQRFGISASCVETTTGRTYSHDNLYHTVLGALAVRTVRYDPQLDIIASCRGTGGGPPGDIVGMR